MAFSKHFQGKDKGRKHHRRCGGCHAYLIIEWDVHNKATKVVCPNGECDKYKEE